MCYDAQKRFWTSVSRYPQPTDLIWMPAAAGSLRQLLCTKSNRLESVFRDSDAPKAFRIRRTWPAAPARAGDDQDGFREGSLAQIKAEIRCLSLLLRLDISNLRFFESCSLFFPQSNTLGQQLPHLVLVRKIRKTDVFNFQTASQISIDR